MKSSTIPNNTEVALGLLISAWLCGMVLVMEKKCFVGDVCVFIRNIFRLKDRISKIFNINIFIFGKF
jgi:hypothetical protein